VADNGLQGAEGLAGQFPWDRLSPCTFYCFPTKPAGRTKEV
jgi:hypothetical protein